MKILLAEDDQNVAAIMQLCLERLGGHTVVLVSDGEAAVQRATTENFQLVILDGMMPKMSGLQAARELRRLGLNMPIIFLSAKTDKTDFLQVGTGFIAKPFEPTTISHRIEEILRDSQSESI